jgi:glucose/arabinose dehydrogenase
VQTVIANIPDGARDLYGHRTRTLLPGPDGYAYLSVGSPCDVCEDVIPQRAAVLRTPIENLSAGLDAAEMEVFASGLRNTVGLDFHPDTGALWGMDMGRNNLGDDLPPEELNLIERGKNYGWPYCFGNQQPDPQFNDPARCQNTTPPRVTFPAHWAPLGVAFYDRESFPASYRGDALIAFHGSAADQTDERLGYRVTRVRFDEAGQPQDYEDLLRGFIVPETNEPWARPAGVLVAPDGSVLISDDFGGRIFRVRYTGDED